MFGKNKLEHKCKNCGLFDKGNGVCRVVVLHAGERILVPMLAEDDCFYENKFIAINEDGTREEFIPEVDNVRFWVEDEEGKPTDGEGTVKIEYPDGFFGEEE